MANQVIVTNTGNVQVALTPPANVQVQISRAAIGTVSNVPTANFANYAGNVTGANQPNITSLGTLSNLSVSGNTTLNNLVVTGNLSIGNLVANSANYANFAGIANTANSVAGANVTGVVANANFATNAGTSNSATIANSANSVTLANVSGAGNIASINLDGSSSNVLYGNGVFAPGGGGNAANANYANFAGTAFNVSGSNVTGTVANANYAAYAGNATIANSANSVALANVSGAGNIASINLDGNASNILFGNGTFSAIPVVSNVANANYANFSGTAYSVSGSNVSGEVANAAYANAANTANLATYATTANAVSGANVSGTVANATFALDAGNSNLANTANSVAVANVSGIGNIATVNLDGNASNILYGNGAFSAVPVVSNVANANYANFAGTAFNVSGSNVSGEVANAAYANAANTANLATYATTANSVAGANVSGEVANANFASYSNIASSANSVALANVVGIGNIANINLDGNASNILFGNGTFSAIPVVSNVANANYANFAGTAFSVSGSNVSGEVANANFASYANLASTANLATFATTANAVAGANVSGEVANANYASYANIANTANSVALANVVGIGNIANINLDGSSSNVLFGNGVFAPESTSIANANYANFAGNVINGTSNISIPTASSNILISTAGNANIVDIWAQGTVNLKPPPQGPLNALRIETYGRSGNTGAQRISSFRFRGNSTTPLGVQPGDYTMEILTTGSNGTALQTNSLAFVRGQVDSSYTANGANIPLGWQVTVNDTNGGINNQGKTHNFYANGATVLNGNLNATGGNFNVDKTTANAVSLVLRGDKTTNSSFSLFDAQFSVTMSNVTTTGGYSPFRFQQYAPTSSEFGDMFMYRSRGNSFANSAPVVANDKIMQINFITNSNNTTTSVGAFSSTVTYNDNAGNVGSKLDFNAIGTGTTGYLNGSINLNANTTNANNFQANNVTVSNSVNGFMRVSQYTAAGLTAITGVVGQIAAVTNSAGGGNPNGMIAFWDTTNTRWSYIHDNSAV